jgi:cytoskeletal protein CcmA (bactofilin family)
MGLFNKKNSLPRSSAMASDDAISSIIAKDMRLAGELSFKGKARIDGTVEGNIRGEHLVLSETGKVYGDLELVSLICHGFIEGNVKAQQVTTLSTASLKGNLAAVSLTVEPGARLNGEITSSSQQSAKNSSSPPANPAQGKQGQEKN